MPPIHLPSPSFTLRGLLSHVFTSTSPLRKRLIVRLTSLLPLTRSLSSSPSSPLLPSQVTSALSKRQTIAIIPTSYQVAGPNPGAVVGIVLGSVVGFILLIILFWSLSGGRLFASDTSVSGREEVIVRRRSRSPRRSHRSRRSASIREVREVTRSPRPSRIIVEERGERIRDPPPPPRPSEIIVEERREIVRSPERRVPGDDVVEVIEEQSDLQSPPRRRDSERRRSRRNSYRSVDPNLYAGGNYPQHPISRRRDSFSDRS
jgi:hypothetical protein